MKKILVYTTISLMIAMSSCYTFSPCLEGYGDLTEELRDVSGYYGVANSSSFNVYVTQSDSYSVKVVAQSNLLPIIETNQSGGTLIIRTREFSCIRNSASVDIYVTMPDIEELSNTGSGRLECDNVTSDQFDLKNTGSGRMIIDTVFCTDAYITNTGSGDIDSKQFNVSFSEVKLTGSGSIDFGDMFAEGLTMRHTSSGNIYGALIGATTADITLTGSGRIMLSGDVYDLTTTHTSSGRIDLLELEAVNIRSHSTGSGDTFVNVSGTLDVTLTGSGSLLYTGTPTDYSVQSTGSGSVRKY